ncbi:hypothetical protein [Rhizobium sp. NFR03]|uniref:LpxL/LpxP family acyltransferase n=1 Tax=Rhizobium sp. NFR03 TaxID=1566263 RepID=UPI001479D0FB|nr:hypothetical protein [Rhizobium sp. NFR03]
MTHSVDQNLSRKAPVPLRLFPRRGVGRGETRATPDDARRTLATGQSGLRLLSMIAGLPLRMRRRLLRIGWRLSLLSGRKAGFGLEPLLQTYLRQGAADARRIALEHDFHDWLQVTEWLASGRRSKRGLIADSRLMQVADPGIAERLAASGENIILAPVHMGIFPLGISFVIFKFFPNRRLLVLRARDDHEDNNVAMERLREVASEVYILNTRNEDDFMDAIRFARKGAIVVSMIDLPETYGSPAETTLFGHPASIALGLDAMARMLKAVVLPMAVISDLRGDRIAFGQPFEVWRNSKEDRSALAAHIGRDIEAFVSLDPAQWHMWTRILEFFPSGTRRGSGMLADSGMERTVGDASA